MRRRMVVVVVGGILLGVSIVMKMEEDTRYC